MAARMKKFHQDDVRAKIQASQLINRLTDHALGLIELKSEQVRSIDILLKKALPDLQAITLDGNVDHKVVGEVVFKGLNENG